MHIIVKVTVLIMFNSIIKTLFPATPIPATSNTELTQNVDSNNSANDHDIVYDTKNDNSASKNSADQRAEYFLQTTGTLQSTWQNIYTFNIDGCLLAR